ncbi:MAG: hypothetical protein HC866_18865 [Leptolyngbyaceae cyanobacterium RU_5_1]|nr:hypothetical protein [Leptolyngbyaceae cyanobacterium RU_5_1]
MAVVPAIAIVLAVVLSCFADRSGQVGWRSYPSTFFNCALPDKLAV